MTDLAARAALVAAFAITSAGCSSDGGKLEQVNPNVYPTAYKQEIINTLRQTLSDPVHVRGGLISEPALSPTGKDQRYTACVRFQERDIYSKQYPAPEDRIAYFYGGHLNQIVKATEDQCAKAAYRPFPEVEKMCLAKGCE
jgi:hypothetical protein